MSLIVCERCRGWGADVRRRSLWSDALAVWLCDDCNAITQGPDHVDVVTGNRVAS